ncbi:MAG: thioredoxin domain-containing protein [Bacteroidia bacterium]
MSNHLANETSPYLLQHAHNPVDWYPWGEEALNKAKEENKLILVSVGYAACHWCHVMEKECFEDEEVAKIMNRHFVCIKVDREERPDVDKIYMDAVMLMTQRGGWPLNAVALPDKRPIYGGTYFPKASWISVLNQLAELYKNEPEKAIEYATNLTNAMNQMDRVIKMPEENQISRQELSSMLIDWVGEIDMEWGGRNVSANKFPMPVNNLFLLRAAYFTENSMIRKVVENNLEKMAQGGIFDHLGGGFARYSVDKYWKVPHFEKMLYDNAQMVSLYAEAWREKPKELYRQVVFQTLEFIERELTSPEGGFYSSLDADSEGEEGKFYVWTFDEIKEILGEDARLFADYYNVHPSGNWEGTNVLFVLDSETKFARRWQLDEDSLQEKLKANREKLLAVREKRVRPGLDDKILTSWNALMIKGYVDAYRAFDKPEYLNAALKNAHFIESNLAEGNKLYRNYKEGKRTINAFLDDYANLIDAYIALYQVTFDEYWLERAQAYVQTIQTHYFDGATGMFFYTSDEDDILVRRKTEVQDDVTPSSNSVLAHALHSLGLIYGDHSYLKIAQQMLANVKDAVLKTGSFHANWASLILKDLFPYYEIAITGENALGFRQKLDQSYHPGRIFAGSETGSEIPLLANRMLTETTIFVCENHSCQLPVHTVEAALSQMKVR